MDAAPTNRERFATYAALAVVLLASFLVQYAAARMDSVTTDEPPHLIAGYTYLTTRDFRLNAEHPPLVKELAALPLVLRRHVNVHLDARWDAAGDFYGDPFREGRSLGLSFLFDWNNDANALLIRGRLMAILLTELLGVSCFWYARALYGQAAGVVAALLILFLPTTLGHGHLVTTDIAVSTFLFLATMSFARYLDDPSGRRVLAPGIFTGLAFASKYTGLILVLILPALIVFNARRIHARSAWRSVAAGSFGVLFVAWLVVCATYGLSFKGVPPIDGKLSERVRMTASPLVVAIADTAFAVGGRLVVPATFFKGAVSMTRHAVGGHPSFLFGAHSDKGWWYYFPVAIGIKTPCALFAAFALALVFRRGDRSRSSPERAMLIASAVYLAVAMSSRADLGVRHVLPLFPFAAVFASSVMTRVDWRRVGRGGDNRRSLAAALAVAVVLVWYVVTAAIAFPNYIAYFNEIAGGPANGRFLLVDSNIDWGQDLRRIKAYLERESVTDPFIVYPWNDDATIEYYGVRATPLKMNQRVTGNVVASVTWLDYDGFNWLKQYPAVAITPGVLLIDVK